MPPAVAPAALPSAPSSGSAVLGQLHEGEHVRGFSVRAVYLDDAGEPIGARFVHDQTGFTLDYVRIESAPQAHLWVTTFPTSDKGEPHTQEHLLLGKGNRGRRLGSNEAMALVTSNAFTEQWRTSYTFKTVAGPDAYWGELADHLDALLNPDYTDEEIRREVRNFGVDKADDGKLHLEEKGTVYNEMVGYYENPEAVAGARDRPARLRRDATRSRSSPADYPAAIRTMTPADIRAFHDGALPPREHGDDRRVSVDDVARRGARAHRRDPRQGDRAAPARSSPKPICRSRLRAAVGTRWSVDYPFGDTANPSPILLEWPRDATRSTSPSARSRPVPRRVRRRFRARRSTGKLVDSKTRVIDLGATGVTATISPDQGQPIQLELAGVRADKLDVKTIDDVRDVIARRARADREAARRRSASWSRSIIRSRAAWSRCGGELAKLLDTPPGFGERARGLDVARSTSTSSAACRAS